MFHPHLIEDRIARLEASGMIQSHGGRLLDYSVDDARWMVAQLRAKLDDQGQWAQKLTRDEESFIANELFRAPLDWRYWAERYAYIRAGGTELRPLFPLWASQEHVLNALARMEYEHAERGNPDGCLVNVLKARQLGVCGAPETRVLRADLSWTTLDEVHVGDVLMATDELPAPGRGRSRKLRLGAVEMKREVREAAYALRMSNGQTLILTADHRMLCKKRGSVETEWRAVRGMRVGDEIRKVTTPWGDSTVEDGWMGGMLDGEGSCRAKHRAGVEICIAQVDGPVYRRVLQYLQDRQYSVREDVDRRKGVGSSKLGDQPVYKAVLGRMSEQFRLIGQTRPTRFLEPSWWVGKALPGKGWGGGNAWASIERIDALPTQRMIDLQTSTKTFIAEGFVSHNSTMTQSIIAHRVATHGYTYSLIAADRPEQSLYLFGMLELTLQHLPPYLRSPDKGGTHPKAGPLILNNQGVVQVESGRTMVGQEMEEGSGKRGQIGVGHTYSAVHLSEIATWPYPEMMDSSLLPAIPRRASSFCVRESTAQGRNNYWHTEWELGVAGKSRFRGVFIPWYIEPEMYRLPPPEGWTPSGKTLRYVERAEASSPRWLFGRHARLTKEQIYWYETERAAADDRDQHDPGALAYFLANYPAEPEESFQHSGRSVFGPRLLEQLKTHARPIVAAVEVAPQVEIARLRHG